MRVLLGLGLCLPGLCVDCAGGGVGCLVGDGEGLPEFVGVALTPEPAEPAGLGLGGHAGEQADEDRHETVRLIPEWSAAVAVVP